ncbi:hypothetical protein A2U01_0029601, partial [Trifolium medium]|nr:hypothetical protein [Trifolium medium]
MVLANQGKSSLTSHNYSSITPSTLQILFSCSHAPTFRTCSHTTSQLLDFVPTSVSINPLKNFKIITMSNTNESSVMKTQSPTSTPTKTRVGSSKSTEESDIIVADAIPITTVLPESAKKKKKKTKSSKKEKLSQVSETSSPSASTKASKSKGKKSK